MATDDPDAVRGSAWVEFRLLGALEAGSGGTVVDLGPPKQRALLAILLLHVGEIVPVDRLIELLWGEEAPRTAGHSIQIYVSELRKALEPPAGPRLILRRPPGYQLDVPAETVDAHRFEALVQRGTALLGAGDRDEAIRTLRSSLELWRGPALSDFAYEEFAQSYVRRFHDLHLDAIETLAAAELDAGQSASVVGLLEAAIREDPLRERSRELLMLALYRSGRHAEALRSFEKLREMLVEELGLEPSPPLQQLRDRVLLHDPSLLPVAVREPVRGVARNPYKGLQPFAETDAEDFFGREALIERLLATIAAGGRLVALVGPSGSGKSSIVAAGLIPRLRRGAVPGSDRWIMVSLTVGPDPQADLAALVARVRGGRSNGSSNGRHLTTEEGTRLVVVIDHFEQLFTIPEESRRNQFLTDLATAIDDEAGPIVVLGLRADFYDRPLQHPRFSETFVPGVVHVLPMTARELEAAVIAPAERVGVTIESKLLAELIAESVARPGSLPLLQYALTELFEQRTEPVLTLAGYTALGGLRGVLSRRAEGTFLGLGPEEQRIATQVFLRLVRLGRGTADSRRRLVVAELADMDIDAVALSAVLTAFARHRLLTFDRDELTGHATVELAHEALLTEWDRLAGWIDRHRAALRRRDALLAAVDEWELSDRNPDYLLSGSRLAEFETWSREGSLQLTSLEREFLEAGRERERSAAEADAARVAAHRRLERSARLRLIGLGGALLALVGAGVVWVVAAPPPPPRPVAMMFTDEGLVSVQIQAGFDSAVKDFGLQGRKFTWDGVWDGLVAKHGDGFWEGLTEDEIFTLHAEEQRLQLRDAAADGAGLILTAGVFHDDVEPVAREFPEIWFFSDQASSVANVVTARFVDAEPSYLAGAAAALTTETGVIGYIGGVDWEGIWGFQAGYEAGARAVDPDITILVEYISHPDEGFFGFNDSDAAREIATDMYREGADVVMHAAGNSGLGLFEAATTFSATEDRHVWAIGVDSDQYETVTRLPGASNAEAWQRHILTSVLKGFEVMTYQALDEYARGTFNPDHWTWGLERGASGLSYSGGFLDADRGRLDALQADILAGRITVPCIPNDHLDDAAQLGIGSNYCHE